MPKNTLGEFEHQVLLTVLRLDSDTYSVPIVVELEKRTGRDVAAAAVYIALRRLEENGLALSEMREAAEEHGGRSRRYFTVTDDGIALLRESRRRYVQLWDGLEPVLGTDGE